MKILHLCLSNFFIDGVGYQENELVCEHVRSGHDVLVIASTETIDVNGKPSHVSPSNYIGVEGARIIRLPYRKFLPKKIMEKLRMHPGLMNLLQKECPDVIMFHGTCGWELITVHRYLKKKSDKKVLFYIDSHEDYHNSARNFLSKYLLHRIYYRSILKSVLKKTLQKILCYSLESIDFVKNEYKISEDYLELYPLGGRPLDDENYNHKRNSTRKLYGLKESDILIVQTGKLNERKKILESLNAFQETTNENLRFIIAGVLDISIKKEFYRILSLDRRISFVGWKSLEDLTNLLCAADLYLQPGTQSVTMQRSLCCRCAVLLYNYKSHYLYINQNGWLINTSLELTSILSSINCTDLEEMKINSYELAKKILDYKILAKRILR